MASNTLPILLLSLSLHFYMIASIKTLPVIHIISATLDKSRVIQTYIEAKGAVQSGNGTVSNLKPGEELKMKVLLVNDTHIGLVVYSSKRISGFYAYEPKRDKKRSDIYWRVTDAGIDMSYDSRKWKSIVHWK